MHKIRLSLSIIAVLGVLSVGTISCRRHGAKNPKEGKVEKGNIDKSAKNYAPGQIKKANGDKSAKEYAPGQQKKKKGNKGKKID